MRELTVANSFVDRSSRGEILFNAILGGGFNQLDYQNTALDSAEILAMRITVIDGVTATDQFLYAYIMSPDYSRDKDFLPSTAIEQGKILCEIPLGYYPALIQAYTYAGHPGQNNAAYGALGASFASLSAVVQFSVPPGIRLPRGAWIIFRNQANAVSPATLTFVRGNILFKGYPVK